jgi:hypothetical protein
MNGTIKKKRRRIFDMSERRLKTLLYYGYLKGRKYIIIYCSNTNQIFIKTSKRVVNIL